MVQKRLTKGHNPPLDDCFYEWFLRKPANKVGSSGEYIMEQLKLIAERLKIENFRASRGYLQKFKERYNIKILHGEGGKVVDNTAATCGNSLKFIIDTYRPEDIHNCNKTGLFSTKGRDGSYMTGRKLRKVTAGPKINKRWLNSLSWRFNDRRKPASNNT